MATTYFLSKRLPNSRLMSENNISSTQRESIGGDVWKVSLFLFFTGVMCGLRAGLWDFSPMSLLRRLETVSFKHNIAQIFLQEI